MGLVDFSFTDLFPSILEQLVPGPPITLPLSAKPMILGMADTIKFELIPLNDVVSKEITIIVHDCFEDDADFITLYAPILAEVGSSKKVYVLRWRSSSLVKIFQKLFTN